VGLVLVLVVDYDQRRAVEELVGLSGSGSMMKLLVLVSQSNHVPRLCAYDVPMHFSLILI